MQKVLGDMKAYLIARVSTADQVDALPAQKYKLTDYAARHFSEFELIEFHESAYKGTRDKFREVLTKLKTATEPVAVVFDKVDRLTRDSGDEEVRQLIRLCDVGVIELHFPSDGLTITENSPATDKMRLNLNGALAQYYSDAISDNVKRRNEQLRRDGYWTGKAPFGYINTVFPDKKKWIEPEPLKSKAVTAAYDLYGSGSYSLKTLRHKIIEMFNYDLSAGQWDKILKNPFYKGSMSVKDKIYPHNYIPLITEAQYAKAKSVREGYAINPKRWAGIPYPYRGLISCAECGSRITFEKNKQKYIYGHCTQFKGKHGARYVLQDDLTEQLESVFQQIQLPEDAYLEVTEALQKDDAETRKQNNDSLTAIQAEISRYESMNERNYNAYLNGTISEDFYNKKHAEIAETKKKLENRRENIELMSKNDFSSISSLLELSRDAPDLFKNAEIEDKRVLLNTVLSNLELNDDLLRWKLKEPYDCMALCNKNRNWLGRRDSNPRMPVPKTGALPLGDALM